MVASGTSNQILQSARGRSFEPGPTGGGTDGLWRWQPQQQRNHHGGGHNHHRGNNDDGSDDDNGGRHPVDRVDERHFGRVVQLRLHGHGSAQVARAQGKGGITAIMPVSLNNLLAIRPLSFGFGPIRPGPRLGAVPLPPGHRGVEVAPVLPIRTVSPGL